MEGNIIPKLFPGGVPFDFKLSIGGHKTEPTLCALMDYKEWGRPVDFSVPELQKWVADCWAKVAAGKQLVSIGTLDQAYHAIGKFKGGWEGSIWETWAPGDNMYTFINFDGKHMEFYGPFGNQIIK